jgi:hypothetical protein
METDAERYKAPARKGRKPKSDTPALGFEMFADVAERLEELQRSVRAAGHTWPSQRTLVSALVMNERLRGRQLELKLLAPFRVEHPDAE